MALHFFHNQVDGRLGDPRVIGLILISLIILGAEKQPIIYIPSNCLVSLSGLVEIPRFQAKQVLPVVA